MHQHTSEAFVLDNFEGPLEMLWHLINRQEIDIYEISIKQVVEQYIARCRDLAKHNLDNGAEFIALAASLVWFKSKTLLPKHDQAQEEQLQEEEFDPRFEVIHHLLDYCRFKQAAKLLTEKEQQQNAFYHRGIENPETKKNLGIAHLSLDDLAGLFRQILAKSSSIRRVIHEEVWKVSDKIKALRYLLQQQPSLIFVEVFSTDKSREELIVTFLALLELMKSGETKVVNDLEKNLICIISIP